MTLNDGTYRLFRPDLEAPTVDDAAEAFMRLNALPVKWVEPIDISNAVLFLASDEARYITGVTLPARRRLRHQVAAARQEPWLDLRRVAGDGRHQALGNRSLASSTAASSTTSSTTNRSLEGIARRTSWRKRLDSSSRGMSRPVIPIVFIPGGFVVQFTF